MQLHRRGFVAVARERGRVWAVVCVCALLSGCDSSTTPAQNSATTTTAGATTTTTTAPGATTTTTTAPGPTTTTTTAGATTTTTTAPGPTTTTTTAQATTTVSTTSTTSTTSSTTTTTAGPTADFTVTPLELSTADCNVKNEGGTNHLRCTFTASVTPPSTIINSFEWRFGSSSGQVLGTTNPLSDPALTTCGIPVNVTLPVNIVLTLTPAVGSPIQVTKAVNFVKLGAC